MKLIVYVRPDVARVLRESGQDPDVNELREVARTFGAIPEPVHPGIPGGHLESAFTLDVADPARAVEAARRLRALPTVEAAFVKPAEEPPVR